MRQDWIITVTNMENENVSMFRFYGNIPEVKDKLVQMTSEDNGDEEYFRDDVQSTENGEYISQYNLIVYVDDSPYIIYTATPFSSVEFV